MRDGARRIAELVEAEQPDPEGGIIRPFAAFQRHAGSNLQPLFGKGLARLHLGIRGKTDDDTRRLEPLGGDRFVAVSLHQVANLAPQVDLRLLQRLETKRLSLDQRVAEMAQRIGRHRGVICMRPAFIGLHDLCPFLQIIGEAGTGCLVEACPCARRHHHQRGAGRCAPALLRRGQQDVHPGGLEIDEDGAAGDTVQNEQAAMLVNTAGDGGDETVGNHQPGRGLDMRAEDDVGLLLAYPRQDVVKRLRGERGIRLVGGLTGRQHGGAFGKAASLDDLAPAVAEPAIPDHHHPRLLDELPCYRLHAIGAAARDHGDRRRAIGIAHDPRDIAHDIAKGGRHRIQGPVGKHHRIFEKAVRVDIIAKGWHVYLVSLFAQLARPGIRPRLL